MPPLVQLEEKPRCGQCFAPFSIPEGGVEALGRGVFVGSMSSSLHAQVLDANDVSCGICDDKQVKAMVHCADCNENLCSDCRTQHDKYKKNKSHQVLDLNDALNPDSKVAAVVRCQQHSHYEQTTYCVTCKTACCSQCVVDAHSRHHFCPLSQMASNLRRNIVVSAVVIAKRERESEIVLSSLDKLFTTLEADRSAAQSTLAGIFDEIHARVDARHAALLGRLNDTGDSQKKTASQRKRETEQALAEFRGFRKFTEELLAQGSPLEIAGSHEMVCIACPLPHPLLGNSLLHCCYC